MPARMSAGVDAVAACSATGVATITIAAITQARVLEIGKRMLARLSPCGRPPGRPVVRVLGTDSRSNVCAAKISDANFSGTSVAFLRSWRIAMVARQGSEEEQ